MVYSIASLFHHYIISSIISNSDIKKPRISGSIQLLGFVIDLANGLFVFRFETCLFISGLSNYFIFLKGNDAIMLPGMYVVESVGNPNIYNESYQLLVNV